MRTPDTDPMRRWLTRISLAAGIAFTATAEYDLARTLGAAPVIAVMLPLAIDAYVIAALRWFRAFDITLSLALMGAAQVAAHLLDARVMAVNIPMVVVISLLVPVALWRTHALARSEAVVTSQVTDDHPDEMTTEVTGGMTTEVTAELERMPQDWNSCGVPEVTSKVTTPLAVTAPVVTAEVTTFTTPDLRKKAQKLNREAARSTSRPVTVRTLQDELGLSRRAATALRREVVEGVRS
ncbi:hypothetical protein ABZ784_03310 [Streptomyces tendae]|uniref:hypothetical protein n=1 Tax=Streptomyces tendae TaxID=1932 RepID=UPI0033D0C3A8